MRLEMDLRTHFTPRASPTIPNKFTSFPKLPDELKICILEYAWQDATANQHRLTLRFTNDSQKIIMPRIPALFQVDSFFRHETIRLAGLSHITPLKRSLNYYFARCLATFFDANRMMLELHIPKTTTVEPDLRVKTLSPDLCLNLKYLHLRMDAQTFRWLTHPSYRRLNSVDFGWLFLIGGPVFLMPSLELVTVASEEWKCWRESPDMYARNSLFWALGVWKVRRGVSFWMGAEEWRREGWYEFVRDRLT